MTPIMNRFKHEIDAHVAWLQSSGDSQRVKRWRKFVTDRPENAICESLVRGFLAKNGLEVILAEDASTGGPDFKCSVADKCFYVEVTCIERDAAITGLESNSLEDDFFYGLMTNKFHEKCVKKANQCSRFKDAPCLLAICCLHEQASMLCFSKSAIEETLTGTRTISWKCVSQIDEAMEPIRETTQLESSVTIRPSNEQGIDEARQSISGLLLCGFGCNPNNIYGVLHQSPARPFERELLPSVEFCKLAESYRRSVIEVEWV
jgi:hypothetical protein